MGTITHINALNSNKLLHLLIDCNRAIVKTSCEEDLFTDVCRSLVETGGYRMAWIGLINDTGSCKSIYPVAFAGFDGGYLDHINARWDNSALGQGPSGKCIKTASTVVVQNILTDPSLHLWRENALKCGFGSTLALALKNHVTGDVIGILRIYASKAEAFSNEEVQLFEELAFDISFGVHTKRSGERLKIVEELLRTSEATLRKIAFEDTLTGLPNRKLFEDRLHQALASDRRTGHDTSVLFLDLNRFKNINDTCGHEAGDRALIEVAKRIQSVLRDSDTVSRFGGDEFAMVLPSTGKDGATHVGNKIIESLAAPVELREGVFYVGASIGVAIAPYNAKTISELVSMADMAMYRAKISDAGMCFYNTDMVDSINKEIEVTSGLRNALASSEFELYFQPIVHIGSRQLISAEVLIRWVKDGVVFSSPEVFIPIAERCGIMREIGNWVLKSSFEICREWEDAGLNVPLSVNLSPRQLASEDFMGFLTRVMQKTGVRPANIEFELTENSLVTDFESVVSTLNRIRELGFSIAIDDFGVGSSSLSLLPQLPVSTLKIDKVFIANMLNDSRSFAVVENILATAQRVGMRVIAEGIENDGQANVLSKIGCEIGQGFLFDKALSPSQFVQTWGEL